MRITSFKAAHVADLFVAHDCCIIWEPIAVLHIAKISFRTATRVCCMLSVIFSQHPDFALHANELTEHIGRQFVA